MIWFKVVVGTAGAAGVRNEGCDCFGRGIFEQGDALYAEHSNGVPREARVECHSHLQDAVGRPVSQGPETVTIAELC